jgi:hypothetical protein
VYDYSLICHAGSGSAGHDIQQEKNFEYLKIADTIGLILIWNAISALKSEGILRN